MRGHSGVPLERGEQLRRGAAHARRKLLQRPVVRKIRLHRRDDLSDAFRRAQGRGHARRLDEREQQLRHGRADAHLPLDRRAPPVVVQCEKPLEKRADLLRPGEEALRQVREFLHEPSRLFRGKAQDTFAARRNAKEDPVLAHALRIGAEAVGFIGTRDEHGSRPKRIALATEFELEVAAQAERDLQALLVHVDRRDAPLAAIGIKAQNRHARHAVRHKRQDAPLGRVHVVERELERLLPLHQLPSLTSQSAALSCAEIHFARAGPPLPLEASCPQPIESKIAFFLDGHTL